MDIYEGAHFPHCDQRVLHAPETCEVCDHFPALQDVRINNAIPFSGEGGSPDETGRTRENIDAWGGNRAKPKKEPEEDLMDVQYPDDDGPEGVDEVDILGGAYMCEHYPKTMDFNALYKMGRAVTTVADIVFIVIDESEGHEHKCFCCGKPEVKGVHYDSCPECPGWCSTCGKCEKHCKKKGTCS